METSSTRKLIKTTQQETNQTNKQVNFILKIKSIITSNLQREILTY
jgi:hypothetical protein